MRKFGLLILILAVLTGNLFAYTYLGSVEGIGDPVLAVTGRVLGMGNTSIASCHGVNALFYNPANMMKDKRVSLSLGLGFFPIKETIENDNDPAYYSSANYYMLTGSAVMLPVFSRFMLGAGYRPFIDLNYKHERKIYNAGELYEIDDYKKSGSFNKAILSLAAGIAPSVNIGFSYNLIGNKYGTESGAVIVEDSKMENTSDGEFSGAGYEIGINCEVLKDALDIGLKWSPSYKVSNEWDVRSATSSWDGDVWPASPDSVTNSSGKLEYDFPAEVGFGLSYSFRERERSALAVDIVRIYWKEFRYTETKNAADANCKVKQNPLYRNTTRISVGVEHYLNLDIVVRYGFTHLPHYSRTSADTTMFTAGVGFPGGRNVKFDIAAAYGKRNFYGNNVFFDDEQMVDERIASLIVSTEWKF